MGVPVSEGGYTSAMPRREDHEVHKDTWGIGQKKTYSDGKIHNQVDHVLIALKINFRRAMHSIFVC